MTAETDRAAFGIVERARRVWAVGAVNAEAERLAALHSALERRFAHGDRLVYLGNYIGRGAAVAATLDELLVFRRALLARFCLFAGDVVYLRGSHEEMWQKLLQLQMARRPAEVLEWMLERGMESTLRAYGSGADGARARCGEGPLALTQWSLELRRAMRAHPGHERLLASVRRAAFTEDRNILFVHAGVAIDKPLSAQQDSFWWGAGNFDAIDAPYEGFARIVRGCDPDGGGPAMGRVAATVDSGCGFGGRLSAVCFAPDGTPVDAVEA